MGAAACKKGGGTTPANPGPDPAPTSASAAPVAPTPDPTAATPDPPAGDGKLEKSEELRFIEGNAELVCFEREKKRTPKDKERSEILKSHGFQGKAAEQRFTELSIRGDKDREWGKRTAERIKQETAVLCPSGK
jgi:hypothetical protein